MIEQESDSQDLWGDLRKFIYEADGSDEQVRDFLRNAIGYAHEDLPREACRSLSPCPFHTDLSGATK